MNYTYFYVYIIMVNKVFLKIEKSGSYYIFIKLSSYSLLRKLTF